MCSLFACLNNKNWNHLFLKKLFTVVLVRTWLTYNVTWAWMEVKKNPLLRSLCSRRWFECNELYKRCETPNIWCSERFKHSTISIPFVCIPLSHHFCIFHTYTYTHTQTNIFGNNFFALKTNRTNHMSILSTTQRITHFFTRSSAHHHLFRPTTEKQHRM